MYVPAMPLIVADLNTTQPVVQLTLSGFVVGLAVGQLVVGPVSDAVGRKKLLVGGAVIALVASIAAAATPTAGLLVAARFIQGLGSGACVVLARSVVPDLATGETAAKAYATLMAIQAAAPIIAPVVGGFLVEPIGWRGLFWVLAGLNVAQLAVALFLVPETRPAHLRTPATARGVVDNYRVVLANPGYRGHLVAYVFGFAAMFCYISGSSFLIQDRMGYSVVGYSLIFAINSVGLLLASMINARLIGRFSVFQILQFSAAIHVTSGVALLIVAAVDGPHWLFFGLLFVNIMQVGIQLGNNMSLGQQHVRSRAGAGSALMGGVQFGVAAIISPLMGLGSHAGITMTLGMLICAVVAASGMLYAKRYPQ